MRVAVSNTVVRSREAPGKPGASSRFPRVFGPIRWLEAEAIERARRIAEPRCLSSYLDTALAERLDRDERRDALLAYLDGLEATDPATAAAKHRARTRANQIRAQVLAS